MLFSGLWGPCDKSGSILNAQHAKHSSLHLFGVSPQSVQPLFKRTLLCARHFTQSLEYINKMGFCLYKTINIEFPI